MAYLTPDTAAANDLITAALWNKNVRDNVVALKAPPSDQWNGEINDGTSSATWAAIDGTNLSLTITTTGGDVRVGFVGFATNSNAIYLDIYVNSARQSGNTNGYMRGSTQDTGPHNLSFVAVITGLSAGSHTFEMYYKGDGSNVNAITSTHFWVSESG
jgi:hypothetical protein